MRKLNGWVIREMAMTKSEMLHAFPLTAIACCFLQIQDEYSIVRHFFQAYCHISNFHKPAIDLYKSPDPYSEARNDLAHCMESLHQFLDWLPREECNSFEEFFSYAIKRGQAD